MKYWIIGALVVVLAVVAWYLYDAGESTVEETVAPAPTLAVEESEPPEAPAPRLTEPSVAEPMPQPEPQAEEPALPDLADSDDEALQSLSSLVGDSAPDYFAEDGVISRIVATVDALDARQVPAVIQAVQGPGGELQVTPDEQPDSIVRNEVGDPVPQFQLNPANYRRYGPYVEMLESVEPAEVASTYRAYEPLFEEAFDQLGYPEGNFEERLVTVIDELLATPEPEQPLQLIKPEAYYLFADEDLEALSAGQKVLLRMGPDNARRVKAKLRQIRSALAAPETP